MKYYKVKKEYDGYFHHKIIAYKANELFTETEMNKYKLNKSFCDVVELSKNKTYFLFGSRIEYKHL